jgi:hypothetical protein
MVEYTKLHGAAIIRYDEIGGIKTTQRYIHDILIETIHKN